MLGHWYGLLLLGAEPAEKAPSKVGGGDDAPRYEIWERPAKRKRREGKEYEDTIRNALAEITGDSPLRVVGGTDLRGDVQRSQAAKIAKSHAPVFDDDEDEIILLMVA